MNYESHTDNEKKVSYNEYVNIFSNWYFHQAIELNYCLEGNMKVICGNLEYDIAENEIGFIPSFFPHAVSPNPTCKTITYIIPSIYFEQFINNKISLCFHKLDNHEINKEILLNMQKSVYSMDKQPNLLLQGYINVILGLIAKNYETVDDVKDSSSELIREIIEYIEANYNTNLTLESIAYNFGYSKYYFSKLFNKSFHCGLKEYINSVRKEHVLKNIKKDKSITDTILENGFNSTSTFYRYKNK